MHSQNGNVFRLVCSEFGGEGFEIELRENTVSVNTWGDSGKVIECDDQLESFTDDLAAALAFLEARSARHIAKRVYKSPPAKTDESLDAEFVCSSCTRSVFIPSGQEKPIGWAEGPSSDGEPGLTCNDCQLIARRVRASRG